VQLQACCFTRNAEALTARRRAAEQRTHRNRLAEDLIRNDHAERDDVVRLRHYNRGGRAAIQDELEDHLGARA
jgi:hypothetical protein